MSYCRFENTLQDLEDCLEHITDRLSKDESEARKQLVKVCKNIIAEYDGELTEEDEEDEEE
jgi:hypothetical protein